MYDLICKQFLLFIGVYLRKKQSLLQDTPISKLEEETALPL